MSQTLRQEGYTKHGDTVQFHLCRFKVGDLALSDAAFPANQNVANLPAEADVLIVGCGPAGLTLTAQLSAFPEIRTVIID